MAEGSARRDLGHGRSRVEPDVLDEGGIAHAMTVDALAAAREKQGEVGEIAYGEAGATVDQRHALAVAGDVVAAFQACGLDDLDQLFAERPAARPLDQPGQSVRVGRL
ncbi:MAG: hypothetical protein OXQ84_03570, partial [bacterium]|nr:hypothetical protein [bacterium]